MEPKSPLPPESSESPTPAEEADQIGGDVNPYPVGAFKHAREESEQAAEKVGSPFDESPLPEEPQER